MDISVIRLLVARHKELLWQGRNLPECDLPSAIMRVADERNKTWLAVSYRYGGRVAEGFLAMYDAEMRGWVGAIDSPQKQAAKSTLVPFVVVLSILFVVGFIIGALG